MEAIKHRRARLSAPQIKAARALLGLSASDLAELALIGVATVRRAESEDGEYSVTDGNMMAIRRALEDAGVMFLFDDEHGRGVRLRKPSIRLRKFDSEGGVFDVVNSDGTITECFIERDALDEIDAYTDRRREAGLIFADYGREIEKITRMRIREMRIRMDEATPIIKRADVERARKK